MLKRCIQLEFLFYAIFWRDMGKILQKIGYFGQFFRSRILSVLENLVFGSLIRYMLQRCIQLDFFSSAIFGRNMGKILSKIGYFGQFFRSSIFEGCWKLKIHLFGPVHFLVTHVTRIFFKYAIFWIDMDKTLSKIRLFWSNPI